MPTLPATIVVQAAALALLLTIALGADLRSHRIPNLLVLVGIGHALIVHVGLMLLGQASLAGANWWSPFAGLAAGFALLLPLYLLRAMGAGDVKLMAMVGAFVGPVTIVTVTLYTFIAGGLLALAFMLVHGVAAQTVSNLRFMLTDWAVRASTGQGVRLEAPLETTAARLPYALAIALGTGAAALWPLPLGLIMEAMR